MTPDQIERQNKARQTASTGLRWSSGLGSGYVPKSASWTTSGSDYAPNLYYNNTKNRPAVSYKNPSDYLHPWSQGKQMPFPVSSDFATKADYDLAVKNWTITSKNAMSSPVWRIAAGISPAGGARRGGGGGGGGAGAGGAAPVTGAAGTTLPNLPPELERWYQEQLSGLRTQEEMDIADARLAQRAALLAAAEQGRAARRTAAGMGLDVAAAMAGTGLGTSPAVIGSALDQVYGAGSAGTASADAARVAALENFLRTKEGILGRGRRARTDLQDWRALQVAALSNQDLANIIGSSPFTTGGR